MGALIAFILMYAAGLWAFLPLFAVLLMTMLATRWGADRKSSLGIAERSGGRNARQVLANLGAAGVCALAASAFSGRAAVLMVGSMAVLAEAAADTVSSEIGQALPTRPRLILGFASGASGNERSHQPRRHVCRLHCGEPGGVDGFVRGVVSWRWAPLISLVGVAGMLFDSILGASFENRGDMGNDSVNFVSTVFAADLALVAALLLHHRMT